MQRSTITSEQSPPIVLDRPEYLAHQQILVVMAGLLAGMLLAALDQSIVGVALPRIVSELGGLDQLSWVVIAYLLATTATTPLWGKISDLYGRRLIFQIAIGFFLIGSALSGLSQNMPQLIAFRAVPTAPRAASVRVWHVRVGEGTASSEALTRLPSSRLRARINL